MNRLKDSASLYLRQHADNPVDWHPWSDDVLEMARKAQKPILLSIGYSACHWCHVMAHESFEDEATAAVMNELFVNIKVDREERPDLDKIYQLSHQLLTQRGGGWPLTLFLDPDDLAPFFAGTYFPPQPRHGLPSFANLLARVNEWFHENRDAARRQNQQLANAIQHLQESQPRALPDHELLKESLEKHLSQRFDSTHGGFGSAPKFPQAPLLALVAGLSGRKPDGNSASMLAQTLEVMALRGLRDPIDGGFYRYCVDGDWTIPHFEKMLYDNAQLLPLYAEMARAHDDGLFREAAEGIAEWLLKHMKHERGGFFASIDADADGEEGGFHCWQREEVEALLGNSYPEFAAQFGLDRPPNFEGHAWHLVQPARAEQGFDEELARLGAARAKRVPPATDTKVLTSWNALAISGLARAGVSLDRRDWVDAAAGTLQTLREHAWIDGRLYAVVTGKGADFPAYLDDHAFLMEACLALLEARWDAGVLEFARTLAESLIDNFSSPDGGAFYFSAGDQQVPMARLRSLQDDATPSGNAIAARALLRLGALTLQPRFEEAARDIMESGAGELEAQPLAHASLALATLNYLQPQRQVIITGADSADMDTWKEAISGIDQVNCHVLQPGEALPGVTNGSTGFDRTTAYVCTGTRCLPPAESIDTLIKQLESA